VAEAAGALKTGREEARRERRVLPMTAARALLLLVLPVSFPMRMAAFPRGELGRDRYLSIGLARLPIWQMLEFGVRYVRPRRRRFTPVDRPARRLALWRTAPDDWLE
jgi:hypothetical protein